MSVFVESVLRWAGSTFRVALRGAGLIFVVAAIAACGSRQLLPEIDEEAQLLAGAELREGKRYAVVTRTDFASRNVPDLALAEPIAEGVADVATELLGVEAVPLDQRRDGDWAVELVNSWDEAGFFEVIDHHDFFASRGFDGYIVAMAESVDGPDGSPLRRKSMPELDDNPFSSMFVQLEMEFAPQFRIYELVDGETEPLMRSGKRESFRCDVRDVGSRVVASDAQACAQRFVDLFRRYLIQRVELMQVGESFGLTPD